MCRAKEGCPGLLSKGMSIASTDQNNPITALRRPNFKTMVSLYKIHMWRDVDKVNVDSNRMY